jgi:pseudouridine synthase
VRTFPVGRLDYQSEGLLLLTNDGELARDLMHPRTGVAKTYAVKVRGRPDAASLGRLARGIALDGRRTLPARLRVVKPGSNSWLEVSVVEGRKHLVRRMLQAIGHPVVKLRRIRYDGIRLGKLAPGAWRHLTRTELERLREARKGGRKSPSRARVRPA